MLVGEVEKLQGQQSRLQAKVDALQAKIVALDRTHALMCDRAVHAAEVRSVRTWAQRYGHRGALQDFVLNQLTQAGACGLDVHTLNQRVIAKFEMAFDNPSEVQRFLRNTLRHVLIYLREEGKAEPVHLARTHGAPSVWRVPLLPTLADLAAMTTQVPPNEPLKHSAHPHSS
jgi:hypothetical protein